MGVIDDPESIGAVEFSIGPFPLAGCQLGSLPLLSVVKVWWLDRQAETVESDRNRQTDRVRRKQLLNFSHIFAHVGFKVQIELVTSITQVRKASHAHFQRALNTHLLTDLLSYRFDHCDQTNFTKRNATQRQLLWKSETIEYLFIQDIFFSFFLFF